MALGRRGSVSVFPPPHQFFFAASRNQPRLCLYQKTPRIPFRLACDSGPRRAYNPEWNRTGHALYNAPPGTWQRCRRTLCFFPAPRARPKLWPKPLKAALAYSRRRFEELPGYKTWSPTSTPRYGGVYGLGKLRTLAAWIPALKALGVNIAYIDDFHGRRPSEDPGPCA